MAVTGDSGNLIIDKVGYTLLKLLFQPDIAYRIKNGCVVRHDGRNSEVYIDDIEAVCQIHKVSEGTLMGQWTGDHYRIKLYGDLKLASVPLNNVIN